MWSYQTAQAGCIPIRRADLLFAGQNGFVGQSRSVLHRLQAWGIGAASRFVALTFVDPTTGVGRGGNWWFHLGILLSGDYVCRTGEVAAMVVSGAIARDVPSALLGWMLQELVVVRWCAARRPARGRDLNPCSKSRPEPAVSADGSEKPV